MDLPRYDRLPEPMPEEQRLRATSAPADWDAIVVGGGFAGMSAAIYLGRALRRVLVIDAQESAGMWEPDVQNFFGFPEGISGSELLKRAHEQARRFGAEILVDEIERAEKDPKGGFIVRGRHVQFHTQCLLLATGLYHLPPRIPGVNECIGKSLFFCKDCDGYKVRDKAVVVSGHNNEAVEYALGLTLYSACVIIATNGDAPSWDAEHESWAREYQIPIRREKIAAIEHDRGALHTVAFADGTAIKTHYVFTTRGDLYYSQLAKMLGAELDPEGQVIVDRCQRTNIPGLYAAGCVTLANCQMIISAGHGAAAAQAINRALFERSLANHTLRERRETQLRTCSVEPEAATV